MKKKIIALIGITTLAVSVMAGCQKLTPPEAMSEVQPATQTSEAAPVTEVTETSETAEGEDKPVLGGWELNKDYTPHMIDEEEEKLFEEGVKKASGEYELIDLVATQLVAGTNYMYLTYGKAEDGTEGYAMLVLYKNLQGEVESANATFIDINDIKTAAPLGEGATGAWAVRGTGKPGMLPEQEAQESFDAINTGDVMYNPVALLGTQVVSGLNYKALCRGNDDNLWVVTWYRNTQGEAELLSAETLDIGAYSGR